MNYNEDLVNCRDIHLMIRDKQGNHNTKSFTAHDYDCFSFDNEKRLMEKVMELTPDFYYISYMDNNDIRLYLPIFKLRTNIDKYMNSYTKDPIKANKLLNRENDKFICRCGVDHTLTLNQRLNYKNAVTCLCGSSYIIIKI